MKIIDLKYPDRTLPAMDCGLVLGNLDGVHNGHRALIDELKRLRAEQKASLPLGAFCFSEPPAKYLGRPVQRLTDNRRKMELLAAAGLQFVIFYEFPEISDLSPEAFVTQILMRDCRCKLAVCGYNYTFGKRAAGTPEDLVRWLGSQPGHAVSVVPPVTDGRRTVSSSLIREMLQVGHPEDAARLLGRAFSIVGTVQKGKQLGRTIGFPTANIFFAEDMLIPRHGVYAVTVRVGRHTYYGIANVGTRPSFDDGERANCEVYLLEYNGDLYGKQIEVSLLRFLREERHFDSLEALRTQIDRDIDTASRYFR